MPPLAFMALTFYVKQLMMSCFSSSSEVTSFRISSGEYDQIVRYRRGEIAIKDDEGSAAVLTTSDELILAMYWRER